MVVTETGAAKAVVKVIPELTGNAIRVPTPNVYLRDISLDSPFQNQIDYTNSPEVVSSDFVGLRHAGVIDSLATIVQGNRCVLYV